MEEYLDVLDEVDHTYEKPKRVQVFRERFNPLESDSDESVRQTFRLTKTMIRELAELISPFVSRETNKAKALTSKQITLIGLNCLAQGVGMKILADLFKISIGSASEAVDEFINALFDLRANFIKFPTDRQSVLNNATKFFEIANFPNVIGCVDGTHVPIVNLNPAVEKHYVCRKGGHSLNCQIICDANLMILNIVSNFAGTTHDSFIFNQCEVQRLLEQNENNIYSDVWLLADSGYGLKPYLLTPFLNPSTNSEKKNNCLQTKTRNVVERCIGVLKNHWRCLHQTNALRFTPEKSGRVVVACCVLHNFAKMRNLPDEDATEQEINLVEIDRVDDRQSPGARIRAELVRRRFS